MHDIQGNCEKGEWWYRGWTLQELIASPNVIFCDQDWCQFGTKAKMAKKIKRITGIPIAVLLDESASMRCCVAQKMAGAASRKTTWIEDRAYSLLGLFRINMPLLNAINVATMASNCLRSFTESTWTDARLPTMRTLASPAQNTSSPWHVTPAQFRNVLRRHINDHEVQGENFWISAFFKEENAEVFAWTFMKLNPGRHYSIATIDTAAHDMRVYYAPQIAEQMDVVLENSFHDELFGDEYLILHRIPDSAVTSIPKLEHLPRQYLNVPPTPNLVGYKWCYQFDFCPPRSLYRVHYGGAGTRYDHVYGFESSSQLRPRQLSDDSFWRAVQFHLSWNKEHWRWSENWRMFISTFSNKKHPVAWARTYETKNPGIETTIMTIDTTFLQVSEAPVFNG